MIHTPDHCSLLPASLLLAACFVGGRPPPRSAGAAPEWIGAIAPTTVSEEDRLLCFDVRRPGGVSRRSTQSRADPPHRPERAVRQPATGTTRGGLRAGLRPGHPASGPTGPERLPGAHPRRRGSGRAGSLRPVLRRLREHLGPSDLTPRPGRHRRRRHHRSRPGRDASWRRPASTTSRSVSRTAAPRWPLE